MEIDTEDEENLHGVTLDVDVDEVAWDMMTSYYYFGNILHTLDCREY